MDGPPREFFLKKVSLGTTVMGVQYDGGVVLGADMRTAAGGYVANRAADKLTFLSRSICTARSGVAAHSQNLISYVQAYLGLHESELNEPTTVKTAAYILHQQTYKNKDSIRAGFIVAGWDRHEGGAVYSVPMGGTLLRVPFAIGGSGSTYIYGWCDKHWKENMTREECEEFVRNAVAHSIVRDGSSGGGVRLVTIDKSGSQSTFIPGEKIPLISGELAPPLHS